VKRLQIYIDEDLDEALASLALREHSSKAALIRQFVAERLRLPTQEPDPLDRLVGRFDEASGDVDRLLYGP
jgi:hypothetical protein